MQLIRYEAARTALAEAHRIDEVKDIRDKAEAMAAYARQARDTELIQHATEIKVRAERRCGEMLRDTALTGERISRGGDRRSESNSHAASLKNLGITHNQSSRYQKLAAMSEDHFETAVATAKDNVGEVTTAFLLRQAQAAASPSASPAPAAAVKPTPTAPQPRRHALLSKMHHARPNEEVERALTTLEQVCVVLERLPIEQLDPARVHGWGADLKKIVSRISRCTRRLVHDVER